MPALRGGTRPPRSPTRFINISRKHQGTTKYMQCQCPEPIRMTTNKGFEVVQIPMLTNSQGSLRSGYQACSKLYPSYANHFPPCTFVQNNVDKNVNQNIAFSAGNILNQPSYKSKLNGSRGGTVLQASDLGVDPWLPRRPKRVPLWTNQHSILLPLRK